MDEVADVAVVGGGPAGAAAAYYLAAAGHDVVVCEKGRFPRAKTCGDGLTPRGVRALADMGLPAALPGAQQVVGIRLRTARRAVELPFPARDGWPAHGLVVRRAELDRAVLDRAQAAGATVLYGTAAVAPLIEQGVVAGVQLQTPGGRRRLRARFVVSAEGGTGAFTRQLGRRRAPGYPMAVGMRQYLRPVRAAGPGGRWLDVHLDVGSDRRTLWGYGWVFPLGDGTLNVGIGGLTSRVPGPLRPLQARFVDGLRARYGEQAVRLDGPPTGGRLLLSDCVWPLHGPGYVVVGDAAGRVNPCTGEGICYAYETGRIAAAHLDAALRDGRTRSVSGYTAEVADTYGAYCRIGRLLLDGLGIPALRLWFVSAVMASRHSRALATTLLANLDSPRGTGVDQRLFRLLRGIAEMGA